VRKTEDYFCDVPDSTVSPDLLALAEQILDGKSANFEPAKRVAFSSIERGKISSIVSRIKLTLQVVPVNPFGKTPKKDSPGGSHIRG
jgi:hypothetical protein